MGTFQLNYWDMNCKEIEGKQSDFTFISACSEYLHNHDLDNFNTCELILQFCWKSGTK